MTIDLRGAVDLSIYEEHDEETFNYEIIWISVEIMEDLTCKEISHSILGVEFRKRVFPLRRAVFFWNSSSMGPNTTVAFLCSTRRITVAEFSLRLYRANLSFLSMVDRGGFCGTKNLDRFEKNFFSR